MSNHDYKTCPGSICLNDPTPGWTENILWYPGEPVCTREHLTKLQKRQRKINKWLKMGVFKNPNRYFTAELLLKNCRICKGTKGMNPEKTDEQSSGDLK
jgi:hypothetical protein